MALAKLTKGARSFRFVARAVALVAAAALSCPVAQAGGPRFVTGTSFSATQSGNPIAFRISNPLYFTDPAALSSAVSHAQADAMVAAAAATWNVPTASLVLAQGGSLNEHVSSANVSLSTRGGGFPADVSASNYLAKPIAVIYDTDGSVTDLLLGAGASDPLGCRQTGVTESVDQFGPAGTIDHALLIINGRCATGTGEPLLQLQYQVERAFGRILGLAWSQLNDNVFTGASTPMAQQISNWPIMHPVDVICGLYTYQCLTSPFSLRPDDRNALEQLYPVLPGNVAAGKVTSSSNSVQVKTSLQFPTTQGMDLVNITVRRMPIGRSEVEAFEAVSAVSGTQYQQVFTNAINGSLSRTDDVGTAWQPAQGSANMTYVEVGSGATLFMTTEAINPLYTDDYAIGPYLRPPVTPSGSAQNFVNYSAKPGGGQAYTIAVTDAAASCAPTNDGLESQPAAIDASGWQSGLLCSVGHTSWWNPAVKGGRSWTLEVDALDESGALTLNKAQPVLGLWQSTDATGTSPTVGSTPASMNAVAAGVTQIKMPVTASDASFRLAVADQFGGGRPDFAYRLRILSADSLSPSIVAVGGGQVTITGRGFQPGMQVLVNGVAGNVLSTTATTIVAQVPTMAAVHGANGASLPLTVTDPATGGSSTVIDALRYSSIALNRLVAVSAPASLETGMIAAVPFTVKALAADGVTPVAGETVRLSVLSGSVNLVACGAATSCTLVSDATGLIRTQLAGVVAGNVTISATELSSGAAVTATLADADPVRAAAIADPSRFVAAGASAGWTITLSATQDGTPAVGVPVAWTVSAGGTLGSTGSSTAASGSASTTISTTGLAAGTTVTVTGCVWTTACATWQVQAVGADQWTVVVTGGAAQSASVSDTLAGVVFTVTDHAGHGIQGAPITMYQTVDGWEGTCPAQGRCAAAPVLASSQASLSSDANGLLAVTPLRVPNLPQVINLAAVTGTTGFATLSLPVTP